MSSCPTRCRARRAAVAARRRRCRAGRGAPRRGEATRDRRGWRRDLVRGKRRADGTRGTTRRGRRHDLERQGRDRRDPSARALTIGDTASSCGNELAASADVILSVGNRFTDWSASSWRRGVTFSIPPTSLIQCDIDPREIGKNYPVAVGLVGDARATLTDLLAALGRQRRRPLLPTPRTFRRSTAAGEPGSSAPKRRPARRPGR